MSSVLNENQLGNFENEREIKPQLNDIKGYWTNSTHIIGVGREELNIDFNDTNMWEGQLILYEDGWFEGIVNDLHSSYTADRLIFGVYFPDHIIELLKVVSPIKVSHPLVFRGKREEKGYEGQFSGINPFGEELIGNNHIITQIAEKQEDIELLQAKIDSFKATMDETCQTFYGNGVYERKSMTTKFKRQTFGESYTSMEMTDIEAETTSINKDIDRRIENETRRLVKELPAEWFGGDDLPF